MKRTIFVVLTAVFLFVGCGQDNITDLTDANGSSSSTTNPDGGYAATTFDRTVQIVYSSDGATVTGADYRWDKHNTISFYVLADRVSDKVVDANAEGTKLKSYTRETGFIGQVGVAYTYSF